MENVISVQKGMTEEARLEFAKRVIESRKFGRKSKGADTFKGKDIIILAMGPSRGQCPFDAETWGLNTGWNQVLTLRGKLDKLFLAHEQVISPEGNPYFDWDLMGKQGFEVVSIHDIPMKHTRYPLEEIKERFSTDFFSDTICYMIAYALYLYTEADSNGNNKLKEPLRLRLYGVDMQDFTEYQIEKGGIEWWLGYAQALGVQFIISFGSTLLSTDSGKPYGIKSYDITELMPEGATIDNFWMKGKMLSDAQFQEQIRIALSGRVPELNP